MRKIFRYILRSWQNSMLWKNWLSKLEKLEKLLGVWKRRNLTIFGKCTIINTLAISKILHNASILQNPDNEYFKNVSKIIYNFIWKKRDRIKRNTLIGKIEYGGIGIIDDWFSITIYFFIYPCSNYFYKLSVNYIL